MTTKEAFDKLISERAIHNKLGIDSMNIRTYRNLIKSQGKYPSLELMIELLEKGGFKVVQEMVWK